MYSIQLSSATLFLFIGNGKAEVEDQARERERESCAVAAMAKAEQQVVLSRILLLLLVFHSQVNVLSNTEVDALYSLKTNLIDPDNVLQTWEPDNVNPCKWFHVTCNNENSVIRIDLGHASLSGHLVPQLGQLSNLQYLRLNNNSLSGSIPYSLTNITSLQVLDLSNNNLSGEVPSSGSFAQFTPNSFANNPLLCGTLAAKPCPGAPAFSPLPPYAVAPTPMSS
ncbi:LRR receptor kinase BAK1-like isoform X3 [Musa acuminata AAA Group]|uniref:LRR receptor kinase BAK1-like isoform X3 n=1 Tax=Musa acuminata AAA Group TaxID=214697 RepID=UPI0031D473BE